MKRVLGAMALAALISGALPFSALAEGAAKIEKKPGSYAFIWQGIAHRMDFLPGPPVPLIPGSSERPPGGLTVQIWPGGAKLADFAAEGERAKGLAKIGCGAAGGVLRDDVAPAPGATGGWLFHMACQ